MLFAKKQNTLFANKLANELDAYAQSLHKNPWFDYDFAAHIQSIEDAYQNIPKDHRSWKDDVQKQYIVMDWRVKKAVAPFIQKQLSERLMRFPNNTLSALASRFHVKRSH